MNEKEATEILQHTLKDVFPTIPKEIRINLQKELETFTAVEGGVEIHMTVDYIAALKLVTSRCATVGTIRDALEEFAADDKHSIIDTCRKIVDSIIITAGTNGVMDEPETLIPQILDLATRGGLK